MPVLSKASAAQVLDVKLKHLANEIRQLTHAEDVNGYGIDLDDASRRMGISDPIDLPVGVQQSAYLVIARWYALVRFASLLATRVDTESFSVEGDRETIFQNVIVLIRQAVDEAAVYGYVLQTRDQAQIGIGLTPVDPTGADQTWERTYFGVDYLAELPPGYPVWTWI
jgi:hypothetical protein